MTGKGPGLDLPLGTTDDSASGRTTRATWTVRECGEGARRLPGPVATSHWNCPLKSCYVRHWRHPCLAIRIASRHLRGCPDVPGEVTGLRMSFSYMGNINSALGNGTMTACQETASSRGRPSTSARARALRPGWAPPRSTIPVGRGSCERLGVGSWTSTTNIGFWVGCFPGGLGGRSTASHFRAGVGLPTHSEPHGVSTRGATHGSGYAYDCSGRVGGGQHASYVRNNHYPRRLDHHLGLSEGGVCGRPGRLHVSQRRSSPRSPDPGAWHGLLCRRRCRGGGVVARGEASAMVDRVSDGWRCCVREGRFPPRCRPPLLGDEQLEKL